MRGGAAASLKRKRPRRSERFVPTRQAFVVVSSRSGRRAHRNTQRTHARTHADTRTVQRMMKMMTTAGEAQKGWRPGAGRPGEELVGRDANGRS